MAVEIERKFLVVGDAWRSLGSGTVYRQGYLNTEKERTVRVRVAGDRGFLTIKGVSEGIARSEFEYPIPLEDANELLDHLCDRPLVEKVRYRIPWGELVWEVDEFLGENAGLILAEIELPDASYPLELPDWIGEEVSHDPRYYNSALAKNPFCNWGNSVPNVSSG
ncbi:MAG TPA: CYTH domain-containing protein [Synechococcales cyanobacterium M55_K2018_004]|nr:CYTH domain-containing protein [Synechococcales cyanobacterium M55_K2018_004]